MSDQDLIGRKIGDITQWTVIEVCDDGTATLENKYGEQQAMLCSFVHHNLLAE